MRAPTTRQDPDVNLATVEAVQEILERAEEPVTRYYLLKSLREAGRSTVQPRLDRALGYFFRLGLAVEGSKGIQWTHSTSESLRRAVATGRKY